MSTTTVSRSPDAVPTPKRENLLQRYLTPVSLEQTIGIVYILFAITLIPRPYMAGLMNLQAAYPILPPFSVQFAGAYMALAGGILIYKQRVGRWAFIPLFLPLPLYALALSLFCIQNPSVGAAGSFAFWCLSIVVAKLYSKRATQRELGVGEFA